MSDAARVEAVPCVLTLSPVHGAGCRKVRARLRPAGLRVSKERARRLVRENGLPIGRRAGFPRGLRDQDGTINPDTVGLLWSTEKNIALATESGQVTVFVATDHASAQCILSHAARRGTPHEILEPIRKGIVEHFGLMTQIRA